MGALSLQRGLVAARCPWRTKIHQAPFKSAALPLRLPFHPLPQIPGCLFVVSSEVWIMLRKWSARRSYPHSFALTVSSALGSALFSFFWMNLFPLLFGHLPPPGAAGWFLGSVFLLVFLCFSPSHWPQPLWQASESCTKLVLFGRTCQALPGQ